MSEEQPSDPTPRPRRRILQGVAIAVSGLLVTAGIVVTAVMANATMTTQQSGMPMSAPAPMASSKPMPGQQVTVDTTGFPTGGKNPGIFTDTCRLTLTAANDPILMPGMTGDSMQHDFFGNLSPTSTSTPAALVGSSTNCSTSADASAYWTPVLFQDGEVLEPNATLIYWRAPSASAASVKTMPAGITLIAGNEGATTPQDAHVIGWTCSGRPLMKLGSMPVDCPMGSYLRLVAAFPNCWDGHALDGSSQKNAVYTDADGRCPASHPVQIPQVVVHVNYPTSSATGLTLSIGPTQQGSILTGHADFMSGWDQQAMDRDVAACIATQTRCGQVTGDLATPQGGKALP